jgi:hypothetical protein
VKLGSMFVKPALYLIEQVSTGLVYVGSTADVSRRWTGHRRALRAGTHVNKRLQAAWDTDGPAGFTWTVLAVIPRDQLLWYEQRALDHFGPSRLLNVELTAGISRTNNPPPEERAKAGDLCSRKHLIDGSRVQRRTLKDGSVSIIVSCQVCARHYMRKRRGIPLDWSGGRYYHPRGAGRDRPSGGD